MSETSAKCGRNRHRKSGRPLIPRFRTHDTGDHAPRETLFSIAALVKERLRPGSVEIPSEADKVLRGATSRSRLCRDFR